MSSRTLYAQHPVSLRIFPSLLGYRLRFLSRSKLSTPTSIPLYSSIDRLYMQKNPVFAFIHDESVNVYLHIIYNGNVQQNPLCVESCVTKEFFISPRLWRTVFDPDANSVLLRAHLCTAVDSMPRKPCVQNCSREREGLYNGNVQQNPLCAAPWVTKDIPIAPRLSATIFDLDAHSVLLRVHFCPAVDFKPCVRNRSREREGLYNWNVQQNSLCAAFCVTPSLPGSCLRFFIAGKIQHPAVHSFGHTPAKIDAPCRVEAHYARI